MKLSIITINLNNKNGLERTLISIHQQKFKDFEHIVIDGGSNDGSLNLIEKYSYKISYWVSEKDHGIYSAMNKGIIKANGEYLLFINSGDFLSSSTILVEIFSENISTDFIYGNIKTINKDLIVKNITVPQNLSFYYLAFQSGLMHPATFIRKRVYDQIGLYNENNVIVSDWEFNLLALCKYNFSHTYINKYISVFDITGISSVNIQKTIQERNNILKQHFGLFLKDYEVLTFLYNSRVLRIFAYILRKKRINSIYSKPNS